MRTNSISTGAIDIQAALSSPSVNELSLAPKPHRITAVEGMTGPEAEWERGEDAPAHGARRGRGGGRGESKGRPVRAGLRGVGGARFGQLPPALRVTVALVQLAPLPSVPEGSAA